MLNTRIVPYGQECAIAPLNDLPHERVEYPRPLVLPLEHDDAAHFARDPLLDYLIREWRLSDDRDSAGYANAYDMHALTIVFRSGRREPCFHPIDPQRHLGWSGPLAYTRAVMVGMFRDGDEGVPLLDREPRGLVTALAGLVGLPAAEARFRLAIIATCH